MSLLYKTAVGNKTLANPLTGSELWWVVQGGLSVKATPAQMQTYVLNATNVGTTAAGLVLNSLTTTQQNALSFPTAGSLIWNSTLVAPTFYDGAAWQQIVVETTTILASLATVGTITSGTWHGSIIGPAYGGTGVANNAANTLTFSGNFGLTLTLTGTTSVTLPTSGTLVNSAVTALSSLATVGTITSGTWQGSVVGVAYGGTGQSTLTNHGVLVGAGTSGITQLAAAAAGTLLSGQGASSDPSFTATPTLGASGTLGSITFGNATSGLLTLQTVTGALGTVTLSLPAATDTLVGRATTDTLSNKTLVAPALGTPASGVLTNCTGLPIGAGLSGSTQHGVAIGAATGLTTLSVPASGTLLQGVASSDPTFTATPTLGVQGTTAGSLTLAGASGATTSGSVAFNGYTSGTVTIQPAAAAGTWTLTLPTNAGTNAYVLQTNGSGVTSWVAQTGVPAGSNTQVQFNSSGVFGASANLTWVSPTLSIGASGTAGNLNLFGSSSGYTQLSTNNASASNYILTVPAVTDTIAVLGTAQTFTATQTFGTQSSAQGAIVLANTASGSKATTIKSSNSSSVAWTLTLPPNPGTNNYVLSTDGSGNTLWVAQSGGGGGTSPGGANTQIQWNNANVLAGIGTFTTDGTNVTMGNGQFTFYQTLTIASGASATLDNIYVKAATTTISGSTNITTAAGFNNFSIYQPTYTASAAAVAITNASTLYVDNAPTTSNGGGFTPTITNAWAISVGAGNVSFPGTANVLGTITSGTWNGTAINVAHGGTGATTLTAHAVLLGEGTSTLGFATIGTAGRLLIDQGSGSDPAFTALSGDATITSGGVISVNALHSGAFANPSASVGLSAVNGSATTAMRSDAAPALSQAIAPTWTGQHLWSQTSSIASGASATLDDLSVTAQTTTVTGNTHITTAKGFNKVSLYQPTYSAGSALTIDNAATLYIDNAPVGGGAGPATITNAWSIWVGAGNVKFAGTANAVGTITSGTWNGSTIGVAYGGTGAATLTAHAVVLGNGTSAVNFATIGTSGRLLIDQGSGADPAFTAVSGDITITGSGVVAVNALHSGALANPSASVGLSAVNGSAVTAMRSDAAPALDQTIAPTWTGQHTHNVARTITSGSGAALDDIYVQAATSTLTGTTTVTKFNKVGIYQPTFTDASAVTITDAATVYIDNAPAAGGSVTLTHAWALRIGAGATSLQATTLGGALTYGGVTLSNAVTGTGNMVLSSSPTIASPTFSGTVAGANTIPYSILAQAAGLSVLGVTGSSTANIAAITGTANQALVVNSGGTALAFGAINLASSSAVTGTLPEANLPVVVNTIANSPLAWQSLGGF